MKKIIAVCLSIALLGSTLLPSAPHISPDDDSLVVPLVFDGPMRPLIK